MFQANLDFDVPWDVLEQMYINFTVRTTTYRQMGPMLGKFDSISHVVKFKPILDPSFSGIRINGTERSRKNMLFASLIGGC